MMDAVTLSAEPVTKPFYMHTPYVLMQQGARLQILHLSQISSLSVHYVLKRSITKEASGDILDAVIRYPRLLCLHYVYPDSVSIQSLTISAKRTIAHKDLMHQLSFRQVQAKVLPYLTACQETRYYLILHLFSLKSRLTDVKIYLLTGTRSSEC
jgi:hypothetical protein